MHDYLNNIMTTTALESSLSPKQVSIYGIAYGGESIGKDSDGKCTFVHGGVPGDLLEVLPQKNHKRFTKAKLLRILQPSSYRVSCICPIAEKRICGGCPLMPIEFYQQQKIKELFVQNALRDFSIQVAPLLCFPSPVNYRIRARLNKKDKQLGFQTANSHQIARVEHCFVLVPALNHFLQKYQRAFESALGEQGSLAMLLGNQDTIHLSVETGKDPNLKALSSLLDQLYKDKVIVGYRLHLEHTSIEKGETCINIGDEKLGPLWSCADSFSQACKEGQTLLPDHIAQLLQKNVPSSGYQILELYAGSGNFTRALFPFAKQITAVENHPRSIRYFQKSSFPSSVQLMPLSATAALEQLARKKTSFDVAVLDPPRQGAFDVLENLAKITQQKILYISCDPMTLSRDLKKLSSLGFRLTHVQPIDLMPQTSHIEVVTLLEKIL